MNPESPTVMYIKASFISRYQWESEGKANCMLNAYLPPGRSSFGDILATGSSVVVKS